MSKGRPPVRRPPGEKKALSYAKDRRNDYGDNKKAARKAIPRRKAGENRRDRRKTVQAVATLDAAPAEAGDLIESSLRHDIERLGGWTKAPDVPLGEFVAKQRAEAVDRVDGKARRARNKPVAKPADR